MIGQIVNCFKKQSIIKKSGKIVFQTDVSATDDISFRIDARLMQVDWGDGENSREAGVTQQFSHRYKKSGIYQVVVEGMDVTAIDIPDCHLISLDISGCETLEFIDCSFNSLVALDVRNCTHLYELRCAYNQLEQLLLSAYKDLFYLACSNNRLREINLSGCRYLVNLYCDRNRLQNLEVSCCPHLRTIFAEANAFSEPALLQLVTSLKRKRVSCPGILKLSLPSRFNPDLLTSKGWYKI